MYRSKPEILRFQPIPHLIFPLQYLQVVTLKMQLMTSSNMQSTITLEQLIHFIFNPRETNLKEIKFRIPMMFDPSQNQKKISLCIFHFNSNYISKFSFSPINYMLRLVSNCLFLLVRVFNLYQSIFFSSVYYSLSFSLKKMLF